MRLPQKLRFLLVGGYNTVFSYVLFVLFVWFGGNSFAQTALFMSYVISAFNNYLTQKFYVFNTRGHYVEEFVKCCGVWIISYFLNAVFLFLFMHFTAVDPYLAEGLAVIGVIVFNYVLLKFFAFSPSGLKHIKQLFTHRR